MEIMKMKEEMCRLRQEMQMNGRVVTFSAIANETILQRITKGGEIIILKTVLNNVGDGYNSETGIFTAPVAGNYAFFFSVETLPYQQLSIHLNLNDKYVAAAFAGKRSNFYDTGGNMVTLTLEKNDRVCLKSHPNTKNVNVAIQYSLNSFSGFLLS
ncbi:cerebellin-1-like [Saccostrea cucullata]|uniref:cerebellin-1-like n=1 Tax=Saccostrea cuccullata TaxID=36930 RepID=UPI002ED06CE4